MMHIARRNLALALVTLGALACALAPAAMAQASSAARAVAREIAESIAKGAGKESAEAAAKDLARFGGEAALRETFERASAAGGEATLRSAAALARSHGLDAMRALKGLGAEQAAPVVAALETVAKRSPDLAKPAMLALAREGEGKALAAITTRFGADALESAARHPGVGTTLVGRFGAEGAAVSRAATTDQAIAIARHADAIERLPAADRGGVLALLAKQPAKACAFLDKNPRFFLIAGAGALFVANADTILGEKADVVIGPDGKPTLAARPGLLKRAVIQPALRWLLPIGSALLVVWGGVKLFWLWRGHKARAAAAH